MLVFTRGVIYLNILINPFIKLLNKHTFAKKFISIFVIIFIPMTILTLLYFQGIRDEINTSESEREGIVFLNEVHTLLQFTQQHRGLASGILNGDLQIEPLLKEKAGEINVIYKKIEGLVNDQNDAYKMNNDLEDLMNKWQSLTTELLSYDAKTSIEYHNNLMIDILDFSVKIAGESSLLLDSDLINYHMVVLVVEKLPMITELMGQSRAIGTGVAASRNKSDQEEFQLLQLKHLLERQAHDVERSLNAIYRDDKVLKDKLYSESEEAISNINQLIKILDYEFLGKSQITISALDYFDFTTEAINGYFEFVSTTMNILDERLVDRISNDKFKSNIIFVLITITMFLISFFFIVLYIAIKNTITEVEKATTKIANGDLSEKIVIDTKDEMQTIVSSLNNMVAQMTTLISANQDVSQELAASSEELSMVTEETAKSTERVTHSIEEITKSIEYQLYSSKSTKKTVEELIEGLNIVVEDSNKVTNYAAEATREAENGRGLVSNTIDQMNIISKSISTTSTAIDQLNQKSKSIGEIIDVIRAIADQTNLLALNAAIEAARAGEHGKGFAVVADEVRKLAEQSGNSAKNIYELIQDIQVDTENANKSMERVIDDAKIGLDVVNKTGEGFGKIVISTKDVQERITDVAARALNMNNLITTLLENVTENTNNASKSEISAQTIAAASQEQLAAMEEIASAVSTLNHRALELQNNIEKFKL